MPKLQPNFNFQMVQREEIIVKISVVLEKRNVSFEANIFPVFSKIQEIMLPVKKHGGYTRVIIFAHAPGHTCGALWSSPSSKPDSKFFKTVKLKVYLNCKWQCNKVINQYCNYERVIKLRFCGLILLDFELNPFLAEISF